MVVSYMRFLSYSKKERNKNLKKVLMTWNYKFFSSPSRRVQQNFYLIIKRASQKNEEILFKCYFTPPALSPIRAPLNDDTLYYNKRHSTQIFSKHGERGEWKEILEFHRVYMGWELNMLKNFCLFKMFLIVRFIFCSLFLSDIFQMS